MSTLDEVFGVLKFMAAFVGWFWFFVWLAISFVVSDSTVFATDDRQRNPLQHGSLYG